MSKCPVCPEEYATHGCSACGSDENSCDCAIYLHMHTSHAGLEEIEKITMREAALSELLTPKINQIIEKVNILIRLKNGGG